MLAFKEFANFIQLNMANLAATYARLLAENSQDYAAFPFESRVASARRVLRAVVEAYEQQTPDPLLRLFSHNYGEAPSRWKENIIPPQPLVEVECLGRTLTPVVTNLEAGKFLWQLLFELRSPLLSGLQRAFPFSPPVKTDKSVTLTDPSTQEGEEELPVAEARYRSLFEDSPISLWEEDFSAVKNYIDYLKSQGVKDFRTYLDKHPEVVSRCVSLVKVIDVNRMTLELYRAPNKDMLLSSLDHIFPAETHHIFKEELVAIAEGRTVFEGEGRNATLDGTLMDVHLRWSVAPGYEDTLEKIFISIINITERKQAEKIRAEGESRYRSLFEDSPISLWEEDFSEVKHHLDALRQQGITNFRAYFEAHPEVVSECAAKVKIVDVNQATLSLYQARDKGEFFAGLGGVFSEESLEAFQEELIAIIEGKTKLTIEAINHTLTGEKKDLNLTWSVAPNYEETLAKVIISIIDITDQKQAEIALREGEARYRGLFEDSPISLWEEDFSAVKRYLDRLRQEGIHDLKTYLETHPEIVRECVKMVKIVRVNRATLELFQAKTVEEFFGGLNQIFGPDAFQVFQQELLALSEGKTLFEGEAINYTLTGERKELVLRAFLAPGYEETWEKVLITMLDITQRKRLEEQVQESLERRTRQVETSTVIAQEIALAPALDDLFRRVVNLVQERFGYYHAHIYTLQKVVLVEGQEPVSYLVMQEGTGEAGRRMKEEGHKIALAARQSLVARSARTGEAVLVPDVSQVESWLPNPHLSETKAELAVPIKLGETILGVLDVQNDRVGSLSEEDQLLLMGLCGQIAVAVNSQQAEMDRQQLLGNLERRARREQAIREITEKMRTATNLEDLIKTTAEELGQRFSAEYAFVELGLDTSVEVVDPSGNGHS